MLQLGIALQHVLLERFSRFSQLHNYYILSQSVRILGLEYGSL